MLAATLLLAAVIAQPAPTLPREVIQSVSPATAHANVEKLASFGTRHTLSDAASETRGIGAARRWLKSEFDRIGDAAAKADPARPRLAAELEEFDAPPSQRLPDGAKVVNVVAILPGNMPEAARRAYYVVGHYDSRNGETMDAAGDSPGANDDASGTVVALECARALASRPLDSTIVFLCTAGEEQGLIGAKFHADKAALLKGPQIFGVLNNDIVGDPSPVFTPLGQGLSDPKRFIRLYSEGIPRNATAEQLAQIRALGAECDSSSRQLARFTAYVARREKIALQPMLIFRQDRFLRGGDHSAFNEAGFAAVRFTVPGEDYSRQHQNVTNKDGQPYGDVPRFVDADYLANVIRLNAATLVHLANAPSPPARVRVLTAELTTGTTLRWDKCPEPDVAGYEVVWRNTTSPDWEGSMDAGAATEFSTPASKDNYFFGVRAYDKEGYRSPVTFAAAARE